MNDDRFDIYGPGEVSYVAQQDQTRAEMADALRTADQALLIAVLPDGNVASIAFGDGRLPGLAFQMVMEYVSSAVHGYPEDES